MVAASLGRFAALLAAALLGACATTTIDGTWTGPEAAGQRIAGPVLVVGVTRDETVRRIYEDDVVAKLVARGLTALPSYAVVPGTLEGDSDARLLQEARRLGARYLLSTVVLGQDVETTIFSDAWSYPAFAGYRGWYGATWGATWGMAWPVVTQVRSWRVIVAQTALIRVDADRLDWVARTRTTAPGQIENETRAFVDVILGAMARDGLVPGAAR
jgi:hypothetical protein